MGTASCYQYGYTLSASIATGRGSALMPRSGGPVVDCRSSPASCNSWNLNVLDASTFAYGRQGSQQVNWGNMPNYFLPHTLLESVTAGQPFGQFCGAVVMYGADYQAMVEGLMTQAQLDALLAKLDEVKAQVNTSQVASTEGVESIANTWGEISVVGLVACLFLVGFFVGFRFAFRRGNV